MDRKIPVVLIAFLFCLLSFVVNGQNKDVSGSKKTEQPSGYSVDESTNLNDSSVSTPGCDPRLWKYVYNPERLLVKKKCVTVTGVIEETNGDEDGDQHMLLKLDDQKNLLTKKNITKKDGFLVIEAVCINNISRKKAMGACDGYVNQVQLPKVGDHVQVTGSYVIDSHNGWAEIHPISKIEIQ